MGFLVFRVGLDTSIDLPTCLAMHIILFVRVDVVFQIRVRITLAF